MHYTKQCYHRFQELDPQGSLIQLPDPDKATKSTKAAKFVKLPNSTNVSLFNEPWAKYAELNSSLWEIHPMPNPIS